MTQFDCLFERTASIVVAVALLIMAMGLSIIGVTILPVLGISLAVPIFIGAVFFIFSPRSKECTLRH